jgi:hypothetical protein
MATIGMAQITQTRSRALFPDDPPRARPSIDASSFTWAITQSLPTGSLAAPYPTARTFLG